MTANTNITPPRVDFLDPRTGAVSREWYMFFLSLFNLTGSGGSSVNLEDLQVGPPNVLLDEVAGLVDTGDAPNDNFAASIQAQVNALANAFVGTPERPDVLPLDQRINALEQAPVPQPDAYPALAFGTYTPTISNLVNLDSATVSGVWKYSRIGNIVSGSGYINVDPTATGPAQFRATPPIASAFSASTDAAGSATGLGVSGFTYSNAASDLFEVSFTAIATSTHSLCVTYWYEIL